MKRGQPLNRSGELKRKALLKGTTRMKPRSKRRVRDMVDRVELVVAMLREHPTCQARVLCRGARAVDVHERLTRARGGKITDPVQSHAITVCRLCHDWITREPARATVLRLMLPSWHRCPPIGPC